MEENKEEKNCPCYSGKHKERQEKEKKDLMNRLKRIEGQVRGIENMLEKDAYCTDVLMRCLRSHPHSTASIRYCLPTT